MNKIIILGAGFAGLAAAEALSCASREDTEVTLVDPRTGSHFLPLLPDVIGRRIDPRCLTCSLEDFCGRNGYVFIHDRVVSVECGQKQVVYCESSKMLYDYLIIASGTETNFYGQESIRKNSFTIDSVGDAVRLLEAAAKDEHDTFIIAGGGYTGIEVATNLQVCFSRMKRKKRVIIAEKFPALLGPLPDWIKKYVADNLRKMGIEFLLETTVEKAEGRTVTLSGGRVFQKAMLIWTAGVKTPDYVLKLDAEKSPQGRLKVDDFLRVRENIFAAGDCANFLSGGKPLRMGVQFSIKEGRLAASNILRGIQGKPLHRYKPLDLGYVIPLANNAACGIALGMKVKGPAAVFLHFFMCLFRSRSWKNRRGILFSLLKRA